MWSCVSLMCIICRIMPDKWTSEGGSGPGPLCKEAAECKAKSSASKQHTAECSGQLSFAVELLKAALIIMFNNVKIVTSNDKPTENYHKLCSSPQLDRSFSNLNMLWFSLLSSLWWGSCFQRNCSDKAAVHSLLSSRQTPSKTSWWT